MRSDAAADMALQCKRTVDQCAGGASCCVGSCVEIKCIDVVGAGGQAGIVGSSGGGVGGGGGGWVGIHKSDNNNDCGRVWLRAEVHGGL